MGANSHCRVEPQATTPEVAPGYNPAAPPSPAELPGPIAR